MSGGSGPNERGRIAEQLACEYLRSLGHTILARNFRCPRGEVDILSRSGAVIVATEVKRIASGRRTDLEYLVNRTKQRRVVQATVHYLARYRLHGWQVRFDCVAVDASGEILHLPAAFEGGA